MNTSLAANASSLPRLESDLYESVVGKDGRYGGAIANKRWAQEIKRPVRERNAVTLMHSYQLPEIQDAASYTGDSFGFSRTATEIDTDVTVSCGVRLMAKTAKALNPEKTVLTPNGRAGCSLTDSITVDELAERKAENPGALVVSCVNVTVDVKVLTDVCCTSSNAVDMVKPIPEDQEILFNPDQPLGAHVRRETGRDNVKIWASECYVHASTNGEEFAHRAEKNTGSRLFIHPECSCTNSVIYLADEGATEPERVQIFSIGEILTEARKLKENKPNDKVFMATEVDMLHQLRKAAPDASFKSINNCVSCSYTKLTAPVALLRCLAEGADEVDVGPDVANKMCTSVERMIVVGNPSGSE